MHMQRNLGHSHYFKRQRYRTHTSLQNNNIRGEGQGEVKVRARFRQDGTWQLPVSYQIARSHEQIVEWTEETPLPSVQINLTKIHPQKAWSMPSFCPDSAVWTGHSLSSYGAYDYDQKKQLVFCPGIRLRIAAGSKPWR
jgi:hypothetical protein